MKNYLVTGAAGFIGSAIAKRLIDDNNNVVTMKISLQVLKNLFHLKLNFIKEIVPMKKL